MVFNRSVGAEHIIPRNGVSWRINRLTGKPSKCLVEMRPPSWKWKLHFGTYDTEVEAMIARDYGALLRFSAGEDGTSAGGFDLNDHPSIYEFDESHAVFTGMKTFKVRCGEFKSLVSRYPPQLKETCGGNSPYTDFCVEARNDIATAIEDFRRRYPEKFVNCRRAPEAAEDLGNGDESLSGGTLFTTPPSSLEVGSYQSFETSSIADNKQKFEQLVPEYDKDNFPSGMTTFKNLSSSPDGKSCQVIRGFHGDAMFDKLSPWIKETSNDNIKKDSKSLLQVQLANCNPIEPSHEVFNMKHDAVITVGLSSHSSYENNSTQPASLESVVAANLDQWMSPISISCSGVPGSLSAGTSVEDETGLSFTNRNSCRQELAQIEEQFAEGEGGHLQLTNTSQSDHDRNRVSESYVENNYQNSLPDNYQWLEDFLNGDECVENQTNMDIDEMVNMDIPRESIRDPSSVLATTPTSTSEVERTMAKVMSKVALNKVMSKAEMVEKRFKGYSALSSQRQALFATRLKLDRAILGVAMQMENKLKIKNLRMAKQDGVISSEKYDQLVKALLKL